MREVYKVQPVNVRKVEDTLRADDIVGRQSIFVRNAKSLGFDSVESFVILDCTEPALKRAEELIKGLAEKAANKDDVLKRFDEQEAGAAAGFGAIMGG